MLYARLAPTININCITKRTQHSCIGICVSGRVGSCVFVYALLKLSKCINSIWLTKLAIFLNTEFNTSEHKCTYLLHACACFCLHIHTHIRAKHSMFMSYNLVMANSLVCEVTICFPHSFQRRVDIIERNDERKTK